MDPEARVSRRYDRAGRLAADTLRIREYAGTAFPHVYGLRYEYDLGGRRTRVHHPENLFPGPTPGPHSTEWRYNAYGEMEQVLHHGTGAGATFGHDAFGRLRTVTTPVQQHVDYDADGRVTSRTEAFTGIALLRNETLTYDARGKIVQAEDSRSGDGGITSWNAYTGLGMLVWSGTRDDGQRGSFMEEGTTHDPLGNAAGIFRQSVTADALAGEDLSVGEALVYDRLTGRLQLTHYSGTNAEHAHVGNVYDAAGNQMLRWHNRGVLTPYPFPVGPTGPILGGGETYNALLVDRTFSYYGADERLRVLDRRTCLMVEDRCQSAAPPQDERSSFEEHRYDALGRRVLLHARQDAFCPTCHSHVVRTVWDGDQILHEISARPSGPEMEQDVPTTLDSYAGMQNFGRVMYVHAGALDYPVAVVRSEYSDSLPNAAVLYPLSNHKGQFDMGIGVNHCASIAGRTYRVAEPIGEPRVGRDTAIDMRDFTEPIDYCVEVDWPGRNSFSTGYRRPAFGRTAPWVGSVIYHGRDPSGQMYRRNRFYDPSSGRFTQEDPIGIAGGLNVYGYAEGDPVSFSDPYGLAACPTAPLGDPRRNNPSWSDCTAEELRLAQGAVDQPLLADPLNLLPAGSISKGLGWLRGAAGNAISRLLGRGASEAGEHLVLGLASHGLERTAAAVGGRHLMNDASWRTSFMAALGDARTTFTVSLDGLSGSSTYQKVMGAAQRAGQGATNWEIAQLYQAGRLGGVNFVQTVNGKVSNVANPFQ